MSEDGTGRKRAIPPDDRNGGLFPKTAFPGSLHQEYARCGRQTCRCARGELHGPYWYRRWWVGGRQRKAYIRKRELSEVLQAMEAWQELHPPVWRIR